MPWLFIVPGIYVGCKFGLCFYPVLERRASVAESLDISGRITKGHMGKIFCLYLLTGVLSLLSYPFHMGLGLSSLSDGFDGELVLLGTVPFLASLLVVIPWTHASLAAAYDSLAVGALPIGLAQGVELLRPVPAGQALTWADIVIDEAEEAVRARRAMETAFAPTGVPAGKRAAE